MKITALALATDSQRLRPGYPPRGSRLALAPNTEICRLAALAAPHDRLEYLDERTADTRSLPQADATLVHVGPGCHDAARRLARAAANGSSRLPAIGPLVFFGPQATAWGDAPPEPVRHVVLGDITLAWPSLRPALESGNVPRVIRAPARPGYVVPDMSAARLGGLDPGYQAIQFARGCNCPPESAPYCPERLYFGDAVCLRPADEVIGEVISLPGKLVEVLDCDVAAVPEYYTDLFRLLWHYRRHWMVRASTRLFRQPGLVRALSRSGTRIVTLDESFLRPVLRDRDFSENTTRALYRSVKTLHSARMLVGTTVTLTATDRWDDYRPLLTVFRRIDVDFVCVRRCGFAADRALLCDPVCAGARVTPAEPSWVMGEFYSIGSIARRLVRRPRRVGFYNTLVYFLRTSLARRQDFLEGTR